MRSKKITVGAASALALTLGALALVPQITGAEGAPADIEAGKAIAMDRSKGNCIACHVLPDGQSPGGIGPALVAIQSRFESKEKLTEQIYDASIANPGTSMPPFGKHGILSEKEFNNVVEYVWSL
jgi:sulfur-oxidizing protein SoxX